MSFTPISNTPPQYEENGIAASGYYIKFYEPGTTTPTAMATDSTGATLLDKCQLNTEGYPINGSGAVFIPHINVEYKIALFRNEADANNDNLNNAVWDVNGLFPYFTDSSIGTDFDQIPLNTDIVYPVTNVTALRALTGITVGQNFYLEGHTNQGVGGGRLKATKTHTTEIDNGGTLFVIDGVVLERPRSDYYTFEMFGAIGDGIQNDQVAIDSAVLNVNTIKMRDGATYLLSSAIDADDKNGFVLFSESESSAFDISHGGRLINLSGQGNKLSGFKIISSAVVAVTSQGIINIDNTSTPSDSNVIDGIVFDCPNHGMNGVLAKGQSPSGLLTNLTVKNCKVINVGRMGIEVLSYAENTDVMNNNINNTGLSSSTFGMGVSISGNDIVRTRVHNNNIGNCPNTCIEIIGAQKGVQVHDNSFFGTNGALIGNTNTNLATGLSILDNTSEPETYSIIKIHASVDCLIANNVFYVTRLDIASSGVIVIGNEIYSNSASAVIIDNNPNNIIEDNLIDNTAATSTNSLVRCFNTGAVLNVIKNNRFRKATGGVFTDNNSGATQNIFKHNEDTDTIKPADDSPEALSISDMTSNTYAIVNLLDAVAGGSRRAGQFRFTVSGTNNSGGDRLSGQIMVSVTMIDETASFTLISADVIYSTNLTFTTTMIAGGFHVQVVPGTGSGNQITWNVENLSTGLPISQALISMDFVSSP